MLVLRCSYAPIYREDKRAAAQHQTAFGIPIPDLLEPCHALPAFPPRFVQLLKRYAIGVCHFTVLLHLSRCPVALAFPVSLLLSPTAIRRNAIRYPWVQSSPAFTAPTQ